MTEAGSGGAAPAGSMRVYLGLGANIGDPAGALAAAAEGLEEAGIRILGRSSVYETEPAGGPAGQPPYLNQVLEAQARLSPRALLARCQAVERALGRDREREQRWGPRTLDIDILAIDGVRVREPDLEIPHPRLAERAFALVPLCEVAPSLEIPGLGRAADLLAALGSASGVRRLAP